MLNVLYYVWHVFLKVLPKMKVSRKMKIISILGIAVVGVVVIACASFNNKPPTSVKITPQSIDKWQKKAPQLFNNAGYSKLI